MPLWTRGGASPHDRPRRTILYRRRPGPGAFSTGPPQAMRPNLGNGTVPDQGDAAGTAGGTHVRLPTPPEGDSNQSTRETPVRLDPARRSRRNSLRKDGLPPGELEFPV